VAHAVRLLLAKPTLPSSSRNGEAAVTAEFTGKRIALFQKYA
jgi:hypothetical protein